MNCRCKRSALRRTKKQSRMADVPVRTLQVRGIIRSRWETQMATTSSPLSFRDEWRPLVFEHSGNRPTILPSQFKNKLQWAHFEPGSVSPLCTLLVRQPQSQLYTSVEKRMLCRLLSGVGIVSSCRKYSNTWTWKDSMRTKEKTSLDGCFKVFNNKLPGLADGRWCLAHLCHNLQGPAVPHADGLCGVRGDLAVFLCRPEQSGPENCRQIVERHLVDTLLFCHPVETKTNKSPPVTSVLEAIMKRTP